MNCSIRCDILIQLDLRDVMHMHAGSVLSIGQLLGQGLNWK